MRGYQLLTNAEIFRGRYLSGFDHPAALAPRSIHEYKFSLHDVDHVFKAGHTVMVEIQSTWFPLYDRNPQTFVPNIMKAKPADYRPATITIYSGTRPRLRARSTGDALAVSWRQDAAQSGPQHCRFWQLAAPATYNRVSNGTGP